jgi:recombination protein RecR
LGTVIEEIFALSSTMEGYYHFYIYKQIVDIDIVISQYWELVVGDELEYADEVTLGRSILQRVLLKIDQE